MTFAELEAILEADPAYLKMRAEQDAARKERGRILREDAAPLLADLRRAGFDVDSAWNLMSRREPYPDAIPILLAHVGRPYIDRNREGIARALGVPYAAYAWPVLNEEYKRAPPDSGAKDGLAVALSVIASKSVIAELIELLKDQSNGGSRVLLLDGLRRSRSPEARQALAELADDPALAKEIRSWGRA